MFILIAEMDMETMKNEMKQFFPLKMKMCSTVWLAFLSLFAPICIAQPVSIMQFTTTNFAINKAAGRIIVTVLRTPGPDTNYNSDVSYQTWDGTAIAGIAYISKSGNLSWNAWDLCAKSFSVPIISSGIGATNKLFSVGLNMGPTQGPTGMLANDDTSSEIFVLYHGSVIGVPPNKTF